MDDQPEGRSKKEGGQLSVRKTKAATGTRLTCSSSFEDVYLVKTMGGGEPTGRDSFQERNESHTTRQLRKAESLSVPPVRWDFFQFFYIPRLEEQKSLVGTTEISETGHREVCVSSPLSTVTRPFPSPIIHCIIDKPCTVLGWVYSKRNKE